MEAKGFSLWLVPDRETSIYRIMKEFIARTAAECGTAKFTPHLTLLPELDMDFDTVKDQADKLATWLDPFDVKIDNKEPSSNGTHFQRLFLEIENSRSLMRAQEAALEHFGLGRKSYFPHMSLAYGDFSPEQVARIRNSMKLYPNMVSQAWRAERIEVWQTEGEVKKWKFVAGYTLGQRYEADE